MIWSIIAIVTTLVCWALTLWLAYRVGLLVAAGVCHRVEDDAEAGDYGDGPDSLLARGVALDCAGLILTKMDGKERDRWSERNRRWYVDDQPTG